MIFKADSHKVEPKPNMRGGDGTVMMTVLADQLPGKCRLFNLITLAPGCSIGYHTHENETELYYFLTGTAKVTDDDQVYMAMPGDVVSTGNGHGHAVANAGNDDVSFVACIVLD